MQNSRNNVDDPAVSSLLEEPKPKKDARADVGEGGEFSLFFRRRDDLRFEAYSVDADARVADAKFSEATARVRACKRQYRKMPRTSERLWKPGMVNCCRIGCDDVRSR